MNKHGIFINYKRSHKHLAGRIYDYFNIKGLNPFMDEYSMNQEEDYRNILVQEIIASPYFLCILTKDGLADLLSNDYKNKAYYKEIEAACVNNKKILMIIFGDINFENLSALPETIEKIQYINHYRLPEENRLFYSVLDTLYKKDIDLTMIEGVLNWREYSVRNTNTLMLSREELEKTTASLNNRFGKDFVECVKNRDKFNGEYHIKEINMVCYAASLVFAPDKKMVDRKAYDYGLLFNIFAYLLEDKNFTLRIITNAPQSTAATDAIEYAKLGNSALEEYEEAVFLGSYANINRLKQEEPYKSAFTNKRFKFMVTDCTLPYALFQIVYKNGWEEFNHIKIDLYSYDIDSSVDRRSMMIFEKNDRENYAFFEKQIQNLRNKQNRNKSDKLIEDNHDKWITKWNELQIEINGDE